MQKTTVRVTLSLLVLAFAAGAFVALADDEEGLHRHQRAMIEALGGHGGFLGVHLTELTPELRLHFGAPEDAGVMVARVVADSPAERAGLQVGDVITHIDGEDVGSTHALKRRVSHRDDEAAMIEVWRDGSVVTLTAMIEPMKEQRHAMHAQALHRVIECEEGEDCGFGDGFDCGGAENCEVMVECENGSCDCTINGEAADCPELHHGSLHGHGDMHIEIHKEVEGE